MAVEETLVNEQVTDTANETTVVENQVENATKTYTQDEVDNMMARMKGSLKNKLLKPYEELGDVDELRQLKTEAEQRQQEQQIKRGEFEKTLQEMAAKKDAEIAKRDAIIKEYKVNTPLLSAAAQYNAVNAEQVKSLLSSNVRLNDSGDVEVVDATGAVRYSDSGEALGVNDLVKEFLDTNPHFKLANPTTTNTKSNATGKVDTKVDPSKLDMRKPEDRALYKEYRKSNGFQ
jgi:hypothetical protein